MKKQETIKIEVLKPCSCGASLWFNCACANRTIAVYDCGALVDGTNKPIPEATQELYEKYPGAVLRY